jgi:uncharacterized membrane protein YqiK
MLQVMLSFVWAHPFVCAFVMLLLSPLLTGAVFVGERQVGIVVKRFGGRGLAPGQLVALTERRATRQTRCRPGSTSASGGGSTRSEGRGDHHPAGEIGLVVAADGASIPPDRILGRVVACDNFQDARAFLTARGEKGRQLGCSPRAPTASTPSCST